MAADAGGFARFLAHQTGLQLVFLNGCSTQQQVHGLRNAGVSAVIATSQAIDDEVAMEFAGRFYRGLAGGVNIQTAYDEAAAAVQTARGSNTRDAYRAEAPLGDRWPWDLHLGDGAEDAAQWSLPKEVDDPLFGLPPLPEQDLPESPFRHLEWFTREHAEIFFGRGHEIRELYDRVTALRTAPIILFYGQSGVGKTSLLAAGLRPRLEPAHTVHHLRRDQEQGLLGALREALPDGSPAQAWREMEAQLGRPAVIILDQVEEVYTRPRPDEPRELEDLLAALQPLFVDREQRPQGKLILGFRKEWLAEIERQLGVHRLPYRPRVFLEPLGRRGIMEAVAGVARSERLQPHYGLTVAERLPEIIADDLLEDPDSPVAPTLQILLTKMWETAKERDYEYPRFDRGLYQGLRKEGILLSDFLDQQLAALETWDADVVNSGLALDVLAFHTTPLGTAEVRTTEQLRQTYSHQWTVLPPLVQQCKDLYLLVALSKNQLEGATATRLSHDTLAPLIRKKYDESDKPGHRARRILETRSVEWPDDQGGTSDERSMLSRIQLWLRIPRRGVGPKDQQGTPLDGQDLTVVEQGAAGMRVWTSAEERLIEASQKARTRRKRTLRILQGVGIVLVLLILLSSGVAWWLRGEAEARRIEAEVAQAEAEQEARVALARQLVVSAQSMEADPSSLVESVLLATESLKYHYTPEGDQLLRRGMALLPRLVAETDLEHPVSRTTLSPDGKWLASVSPENMLQIWEAETGREVAQLAHEDPVWAVAFGRDGRWMATTTKELTADDQVPRAGKVLVWDLANMNRVWELEHEGAVASVAISPDGQWVAAAALTGDDLRGPWEVKVWETASGNEKHGWEHNRPALVTFSPDGRYLASVDRPAAFTYRIRVWDVTTGEPKTQIETESQVSAIEFSPDGRLLALGSSEGTAQLFNVETGVMEAQVDHGESIRSIAFHPGDTLPLITGGWDGTARVWKYPDKYGLLSIKTRVLPFNVGPLLEAGRMVHKGSVEAVAYNVTSDSERIVSVAGSAARLWELPPALDRLGPVVPEEATAIAVNPGGQVASVHDFSSPDGMLMLLVWDLNTGQEVARIEIETEEGFAVTAVALSPDGRWVAAGGGDLRIEEYGSVWVWETATGREVARMSHAEAVQELAFSPDGHLLFSRTGDRTIRAWEVDGFEEVSWDRPEPELEALVWPWIEIIKRHNTALTADGQWLAEAYDNGEVIVYEVATEEEIGQIEHDTGKAIYALALSPDGRWLATAAVAGADRAARVRVWEVATGQEIARSEIPAFEPGDPWGGDVSALTFSPDGRQIMVAAVSLSHTSYSKAWMWNPEDLIKAACERLPRNLSSLEWERYLPDQDCRATCDNLPACEEGRERRGGN